MEKPPEIGISSTLDQAACLHRRCAELFRDLPFEPKGILNSEMLFVLAAVGEHRPSSVVESGRARGQSTCLLALCFPATPIFSVEVDPDSPDVPVAAARLRDFANVKLIFGDSRRLLFDLVGPDDVVIIDGPKGHRGLKLALRLLASRKPLAVFIHDCYQGSDERRFLEPHVPGAFFSDHPDFEASYAYLDDACWSQAQAYGGWMPHRFEGHDQRSYGPTYGCLPYVSNAPYGRILRRLEIVALIERTKRSFWKRLSKWEQIRSSKSETNSKPQSPKIPKLMAAGFGHSNLPFRISSFGF